MGLGKCQPASESKQTVASESEQTKQNIGNDPVSGLLKTIIFKLANVPLVKPVYLRILFCFLDMNRGPLNIPLPEPDR